MFGSQQAAKFFVGFCFSQAYIHTVNRFASKDFLQVNI